jgi:hypothetical protein
LSSPSEWGALPRKARRPAGQHVRNPCGGKPGPPSKIEEAERERKKKQLSRKYAGIKGETQHEDLDAGPSGPEPMPDMLLLGARATANKKVKQLVEISRKITGATRANSFQRGSRKAPK